MLCTNNLLTIINLCITFCVLCVAKYKSFIGRPHTETDFPILQSVIALATTHSVFAIVSFLSPPIWDRSPYACSKKGVLTGPGQTAVTLIPFGFNSFDNARLKEYT